MLVFKRSVGEQIILPTSQAAITVVGVTGNTVRLGITAPEDFAVERMEQRRRDRPHLADAAPPFDVAPPKPIRVVIPDADDLLRQQLPFSDGMR